MIEEIISFSNFSILLGMFMMVFCRPIGAGCYFLNQILWSRYTEHPLLENHAKMALKSINKKKAPSIVLILGFCFIIQGVVLLSILI